MTKESIDILHALFDNHFFTNHNSLLISEERMCQNISYGLNQNRELVILLPPSLNIYPVKIGEIVQIRGANNFTSIIDDSSIAGIPFVYSNCESNDQAALLDIFYSLAASEDFEKKIVDFVELLLKANQRGLVFDASSFFGELAVVYSLVDERENIVTSWQSTGNSTFDIISQDSFPAIEIKSTSNIDSRMHTLSLHQIRQFSNNPGSILASVQIIEDYEGVTCRQVCSDLKKKLVDNNLPGIECLESILICLSNSKSFNEDKFCLTSTISSIKYISPDFSDLKLTQPPPYLVSAKVKVNFDLLPASN